MATRPGLANADPVAARAGSGRADSPRWLVHARGAAGVWLAAAAVMTLARNPQWRDNRTLFLHDVRVEPHSVVLRLRAAEIHLRAGDPAAAEIELEAARRILPDDPLVLNNLGDLHRLTGRPQSAEALIRRSLEMSAQPPWHGYPADRYLALYNLGLLRSGQGRPAEAIPWLRKSLLYRADYRPAWDALLQAGLGAAPVDDLHRWLAQAEAAFLGDPLWLYYRGLVLLAREERAAEAQRLLAEALRQKPEELRFHVALADLYAQTGRWGESAQRYREVLRRFPLTGAQQAEIRNRLRLIETRGG